MGVGRRLAWGTWNMSLSSQQRWACDETKIRRVEGKAHWNGIWYFRESCLWCVSTIYARNSCGIFSFFSTPLQNFDNVDKRWIIKMKKKSFTWKHFTVFPLNSSAYFSFSSSSSFFRVVSIFSLMIWVRTGKVENNNKWTANVKRLWTTIDELRIDVKNFKRTNKTKWNEKGGRIKKTYLDQG